ATRAPAGHRPTTGTTPTSPGGSTPTGPRCPTPASPPAAPTTSCAASATRLTPQCPAGEADAGGSGGPHATDAPRPSAPRRPRRFVLLAAPSGTSPGRGQPRKTGAATPPAGPPHRSSCRRNQAHAVPRTEVRQGARATRTRPPRA